MATWQYPAVGNWSVQRPGSLGFDIKGGKTPRPLSFVSFSSVWVFERERERARPENWEREKPRSEKLRFSIGEIGILWLRRKKEEERRASKSLFQISWSIFESSGMLSISCFLLWIWVCWIPLWFVPSFVVWGYRRLVVGFWGLGEVLIWALRWVLDCGSCFSLFSGFLVFFVVLWRLCPKLVLFLSLGVG